jgi:hypothetical protein
MENIAISTIVGTSSHNMIIGVTYLGTKSNIFFKTILTQIYGPIIFFKVDRGRIQTFLKERANRGTQTQRLNFIEE